MEIREYNLIRQAKYRYKTIPSVLIVQAMARGIDRQVKQERLGKIIDRIIIGFLAAGGWYLIYHLVTWVRR